MLEFSSPALLGLLALPVGLAFWRRRSRSGPALRLPDLPDSGGSGAITPKAASGAARVRGSITSSRKTPPPPPRRDAGIVAGLGRPKAPGSFWLGVARFLPVMKYGAMVLIVLALAGPREGKKEVEVLTEGINIVLAVDASETMAALDFKREDQVVNRLEAVKGVVRDFIANRFGDRVGIVVFGTEAYTQLPLTRDYDTLLQVLDKIEIGSAGPQTAIGDALGVSLKRLRDVQSKSNVIVLLTDGRSNAGELTPEAAADIATRAGVTIYTIGVGGREPAPFVVTSPLFGRRLERRNVEIDEKTLERIARKTGGLYFRAENTEGLRRCYETINNLEKNEVKVKTHADYTDLYPWLVLPAFCLLALWAVLGTTRCLRLP